MTLHQGGRDVDRASRVAASRNMERAGRGGGDVSDPAGAEAANYVTPYVALPQRSLSQLRAELDERIAEADGRDGTVIDTTQLRRWRDIVADEMALRGDA